MLVNKLVNNIIMEIIKFMIYIRVINAGILNININCGGQNYYFGLTKIDNNHYHYVQFKNVKKELFIDTNKYI